MDRWDFYSDSQERGFKNILSYASNVKLSTVQIDEILAAYPKRYKKTLIKSGLYSKLTKSDSGN